MKRIWTVAQREWQALFDHPTGYVLLVVFAAVNAFLFFRQAYLSNVASLRPMLDLLPWVFLFFVPAVAMRTLAEDNRSGMLEVVLTQSLTEGELVAGKYLGAVLFLWCGLAVTFAIPLGLSLGARLHWGTIVAQYVGAALLAAGMCGVGVWASTLTRSQIMAFILAVSVMFVLILLGLNPLIVGLPPSLGSAAARVGVLSHFENIGRGVIDLRDAIYFLSLAGVFLAFAYGALLRRKLAPGGAPVRRMRLGMLLVTAILVVVNLLGGYIGGRLDLTPGRAYTLSGATRHLVGNLGDILTVKVFASDALPTEISLIKRDVDDLLADIRSSGKGKVRVVTRNPTDDESARRDAGSLGIRPVQFNVVGQSELQVKEGYLGLALQYGGQTETIPFIDRTDDLEYRIASDVRSLTRAGKSAVAIVSSVSTPNGGVENLRTQLARSYEVRDLSLSDAAQPAADVVAVVLAGVPDSLPPGAVDRLTAYLRRGGSVLVLANGMQLSPQMPIAMPRPVMWNDVLKPLGVSVRSDMVYDMLTAESVPGRSTFMGMRVMQRYPFFFHASSTGKSVVNRQVSDVLLTWPSSIDTTGARPGSITPLLVSSRGSGVATGETTIDPGRDFPQTDLAPRLLAVQVAPAAATDTTALRGRAIVIGDATFASDLFAEQAPENLDFVLNAVDWLAQDEALIAIRSKDRRPPSLAFAGTASRDFAKYGNMIGIPALLALAGVVRLTRRRRRTHRTYRLSMSPRAGGS
jgi:gliding motility-associatede transport system auxiliary component